MERAWSTRTHEHVRQACEDGGKMIDRLAKLSGQVYSVAHAFPTYAGEVPLTEYGTQEGVPNKLYFVPRAKALIFYKSIKAGVLLGVEQGQGFVIARLGDAMSNRWSAPAFVRITGIEFGLVAGVDRAETLVGVMSDRALEGLIASKGKFNMSSNWNFELTPLEEDKSGGSNPSWTFNADFTSASVAKGIMADVAIQGTRIQWDATWNSHCYGEGMTPARFFLRHITPQERRTSSEGMRVKILRGEVEPPPELSTLTDKLRLCCAPQMAGIGTEARRSRADVAAEPAGMPVADTGAAAATTTTTTRTTMAAPAAVPVVPVS